MFSRFFGLDAQRQRLLKRAPEGPLRRYLQHPFPSRKTNYHQVEYLALDLEMTGLDPRRDHILSVGWVVLSSQQVDLTRAGHLLVRSPQAIPEASAVIHHITDDQAAQGQELAEVLPLLLELLTGRVMVAHYAALERGFLAAACERVYGLPLPIPIIDTQMLALRALHTRHQVIKPQEMRLHALRERYNLPRYPAHNALSDALATAELFLAQLAYRDQGRAPLLRDLLLPP